MYLRFKKNQEPCIQYELINGTSVWEYDEYFKKYMECIEIECMGLVPKHLLTRANHPNNLNAIDLEIYLTNNNDHD
jgi:hypothetical protein